MEIEVSSKFLCLFHMTGGHSAYCPTDRMGLQSLGTKHSGDKMVSGPGWMANADCHKNRTSTHPAFTVALGRHRDRGVRDGLKDWDTDTEAGRHDPGAGNLWGQMGEDGR